MVHTNKSFPLKVHFQFSLKLGQVTSNLKFGPSKAFKQQPIIITFLQIFSDTCSKLFDESKTVIITLISSFATGLFFLFDEFFFSSNQNSLSVTLMQFDTFECLAFRNVFSQDGKNPFRTLIPNFFQILSLVSAGLEQTKMQAL